jgi:hypothetical protein
MDWPIQCRHHQQELTLSIDCQSESKYARRAGANHSDAAPLDLLKCKKSNSQPGSSNHQQLVVLSSSFEIRIPCMPEETQSSKSDLG